MATDTSRDQAVGRELQPSAPERASLVDEKQDFEAKEKHLETTGGDANNLTYDYDEEEPEIHMRTWIAIGAMWLLNFVQVVALQAPPAVVCSATTMR